jgi:hypothetical protein
MGLALDFRFGYRVVCPRVGSLEKWVGMGAELSHPVLVSFGMAAAIV